MKQDEDELKRMLDILFRVGPPSRSMMADALRAYAVWTSVPLKARISVLEEFREADSKRVAASIRIIDQLRADLQFRIDSGRIGSEAIKQLQEVKECITL